MSGLLLIAWCTVWCDWSPWLKMSWIQKTLAYTGSLPSPKEVCKLNTLQGILTCGVAEGIHPRWCRVLNCQCWQKSLVTVSGSHFVSINCCLSQEQAIMNCSWSRPKFANSQLVAPFTWGLRNCSVNQPPLRGCPPGPSSLQLLLGTGDLAAQSRWFTRIDSNYTVLNCSM